MAYFIFLKNQDNEMGVLHRIAENESDLNSLNIIKSEYKIIEDSQINFENVKYNIKNAVKYNGNTITYLDSTFDFSNKKILLNYISSIKLNIKNFLDNNKNNPLFNTWNNYYNQLDTLDLDSINYPLNKSLEQYFNEQGQLSLNTLQLP